MDEGLGALLSELRAEGLHDTSGRFTLDLTQARSKLGRFQLGGYHFLIPLVAAAVLSGAQELELRLAADSIEIEFDGQPLDLDTLRSLFSHLLSNQSHRRLRELAVAINSAMGAGYQVTLESHGERLIGLIHGVGADFFVLFGRDFAQVALRFGICFSVDFRRPT